MSSTGKDPWHNDSNYWGDIEFGSGFPLVATPVESLLTVASPGSQVAATRGSSQPQEYYTLSGRRVFPAHVFLDHRRERRGDLGGGRSRGVLMAVTADQPPSKAFVLDW